LDIIMSRIHRLLFFAAAFFAVFSARAIAVCADEASQTFKQAKPALQTQLRSKQTADRIQAFYQLRQYHETDAAKLVLQIGLRDASPEVRVAAYETLRTYADDSDICNLLFASLRKAVKAKGVSQGADVLLAVLLASEEESVVNDVSTFLDKQMISAPNGAALVALTADNLGLHGEPQDLPPLKKLTTTKLFQDNFAVRRAVVQAIMRVREPATIELLIALLGDLKGEARGDIVQYLTEITKQEFKLNAAAWKEWWDGAKKSFTYPPMARGIVVRAREAGSPSSYYGLPLFAQRIVFVFDTSGSMAGPRLAAGQRELVNAITSLPAEASFGIIVFNSRVDAWQKRLVPATKDNKDAATRFIGGLAAREQTGTYDALTAAFNYDAEAIYLLTDGAPTIGRLVEPSDIVNAITHGNLARRLSIYTIGVDVGPEGELFDAFLKGLAEQNYGQYRRVDN
jgi:hypothetical protein